MLLVPILISLFSLMIAFAGFRVASLSLQTTRGLNRAKFLYDLHRDFFVQGTYKSTLDALDEPSGDPRIVGLVSAEDSDLLGLLNAFELVAYFEHTKQLKFEDTDALLDYYLRCIQRHTELRQYISNKNKSFEHLDALLARVSEKPHGA
jgi:hypothetical protein